MSAACGSFGAALNQFCTAIQAAGMSWQSNATSVAWLAIWAGAPWEATAKSSEAPRQSPRCSASSAATLAWAGSVGASGASAAGSGTAACETGGSAAALTPADGSLRHPDSISAATAPTDRVIQIRVAPMGPLYIQTRLVTSIRHRGECRAPYWGWICNSM